jgi:NDP-sugar pyrophosphorylase family protein
MQIIIPMSGAGERFRRSGYGVPKPMIPVDGKPMIAHVIDLFPGATGILFICSREHLADASLGMAEAIRRHHPSARIVAIEPHERGPVHAVLAAARAVDPHRPTIVNYCDFSCVWDYGDFVRFVGETGCDGAIPAYRGFHPHSLGSTYYAYVRERGLWIDAIQEKQPFTAAPMQEFASSGTYYFRSGALMLDCFGAAVARGLRTGGEFYASLAYRPLLERGGRVAVYELQHFLQWGTPEDLEAYLAYSRLFAALAKPRDAGAEDAVLLMPMAGAGRRFAEAGYAAPKPLVPVSGLPMAVQAARDLPACSEQRFVLRRDLAGVGEIAAALAHEWPAAKVVMIDALTEGQAITCLAGLDGVPDGRGIIIGACDNGLIYDAAALTHLIADPGTDAVVFGARGHPPARRTPAAYGWIDADAAGAVRRVSVKVPLADPRRDPIVVGAFWFRRAGDFRRAVARMVEQGRRVNGEFYVDESLNAARELGLAVRLFEVAHYAGWGTPDELRSFDYWQSCFHKLARHPYRLERDSRVPPPAVAALAERYSALRPARPATWPERGPRSLHAAP